jgi:copper(I)-binding protein
MATPVSVAGAGHVGAVPVSMLIRNDGDEADRLLGGTSPVAARIEPHRTRLVRGQREMTALPDGIVIPPGDAIVLEPGADHLMLIGLREPLIQGRTFPLTLRFARAGNVTVQARVRRRVDAAGITPFPPMTLGELSVSMASAPPAPRDPQGTPSPVGKARPKSPATILALFHAPIPLPRHDGSDR